MSATVNAAATAAPRRLSNAGVTAQRRRRHGGALSVTVVTRPAVTEPALSVTVSQRAGRTTKTPTGGRAP